MNPPPTNIEQIQAEQPSTPSSTPRPTAPMMDSRSPDVDKALGVPITKMSGVAIQQTPAVVVRPRAPGAPGLGVQVQVQPANLESTSGVHASPRQVPAAPNSEVQPQLAITGKSTSTSGTQPQTQMIRSGLGVLGVQPTNTNTHPNGNAKSNAESNESGKENQPKRGPIPEYPYHRMHKAGIVKARPKRCVRPTSTVKGNGKGISSKTGLKAPPPTKAPPPPTTNPLPPPPSSEPTKPPPSVPFTLSSEKTFGLSPTDACKLRHRVIERRTWYTETLKEKRITREDVWKKMVKDMQIFNEKQEQDGTGILIKKPSGVKPSPMKVGENGRRVRVDAKSLLGKGATVAFDEDEDTDVEDDKQEDDSDRKGGEALVERVARGSTTRKRRRVKSEDTEKFSGRQRRDMAREEVDNTDGPPPAKRARFTTPKSQTLQTPANATTAVTVDSEVEMTMTE